MAITFRHDAAAVALPANSANRKYGQQLVLQQQQQKYQGHQAGLDRLFDANKIQQQNQFQWNRDQQQRNFQWDMGHAQNKFQADRDKAKFEQQQQQQRKADFDAARNRIDTHAKDMLANGEITDPEARQRIQNLIAGKTIVMGSDFDETARQNYLDQYNAELAKILSEVPPAKPKPPPQPNFHTDQNGNQWVESGPGKWEQVPPQEKKPTSLKEYYNGNEDKFQKDLDATMKSMQDEVDLGNSTGPVTPEAAWKKMQEAYDFRQKALGRSSQPPAGAPPAGSGSLPMIPPARGMVDPVTGQQYQTGALGTMPQNPAAAPPPAAGGGIPEGPMVEDYPGQAAAIAGLPAAQPTQSQSAWDALQQAQSKWNAAYGAAGQGQNPQAAPGLTPEQQQAQSGWAGAYRGQAPSPQNPFADVTGVGQSPTAAAGQSPIDRGIALAPGHPDYKGPARPTGQFDENGYAIMDDGSRVDPRDYAAMKGTGMVQDVARNFNPDGTPKELGGNAKWQEETGGITIESASEAAQQYEAAAQEFQELQPKMQAIGQELNNLNSGPWSTNKDVVKRKKELKEEKKKLESLSKQYQESMKAADETAKGYYDQEIAKQPAVKNLSKAGKRPQDFAEAEFQLQNLRKQYPDMGSMPAEAKKQLIEAMAVIKAGR